MDRPRRRCSTVTSYRLIDPASMETSPKRKTNAPTKGKKLKDITPARNIPAKKTIHLKKSKKARVSIQPKTNKHAILDFGPSRTSGYKAIQAENADLRRQLEATKSHEKARFDELEKEHKRLSTANKKGLTARRKVAQDLAQERAKSKQLEVQYQTATMRWNEEISKYNDLVRTKAEMESQHKNQVYILQNDAEAAAKHAKAEISEYSHQCLELTTLNEEIEGDLETSKEELESLEQQCRKLGDSLSESQKRADTNLEKGKRWRIYGRRMKVRAELRKKEVLKAEENLRVLTQSLQEKTTEFDAHVATLSQSLKEETVKYRSLRCALQAAWNPIPSLSEKHRFNRLLEISRTRVNYTLVEGDIAKIQQEVAALEEGDAATGDQGLRADKNDAQDSSLTKASQDPDSLENKNQAHYSWTPSSTVVKLEKKISENDVQTGKLRPLKTPTQPAKNAKTSHAPIFEHAGNSLDKSKAQTSPAGKRETISPISTTVPNLSKKASQ